MEARARFIDRNQFLQVNKLYCHFDSVVLCFKIMAYFVHEAFMNLLYWYSVSLLLLPLSIKWNTYWLCARETNCFVDTRPPMFPQVKPRETLLYKNFIFMDLLAVKVTGNDDNSGIFVVRNKRKLICIPLLSSFPVTLTANKSMKMKFLSYIYCKSS